MVFSSTGLGGSRSKLYVPSSENVSVPTAQNLSKGIYDDDGGEALDDTRICVCLRLRPMNKLEASRRSKNCVEVHRSGTGLTIDSPLDGEFNFSFDRVFDEKAPQNEVFQHAVSPVPYHLLRGYNCTVFAYGQTGSGKTHSMLGAGGIGWTLDATQNYKLTKLGVLNNENNGDEKKSSIDSAGSNENTDDEEIAGLIPRTAMSIFDLMGKSPSHIEYTVRCSYVEIYLEKALDLLSPGNDNLNIVEDFPADEAAGISASDKGDSSVAGVKIQGASEACCFDESDVIALLMRGNAHRTVSSTNLNTESSRSHAIFSMKIEQNNLESRNRKASVLHMVDLAGSEMASKNQKKGNTMVEVPGGALQREGMMINKSLFALTLAVKQVAENQRHGTTGNGALAGIKSISRKSKLTRFLLPAFGGNCLTTLLLTASPSTYNVSETMDTIRFGQRCRRIENSPSIQRAINPADFARRLASSEEMQDKLITLVKELASECHSLKPEGTSWIRKNKTPATPLWETIETIVDENEVGTKNDLIKKIRSRKLDEKSTTDDDKELGKSDIAIIDNVHENAENAELRSEVAILRSQNEKLLIEKEKNQHELFEANAKIQMLSQQKMEVEHNLRTSQFRENEATVFLRQFRRFYRRLLKNKAAQGTGDTSEITAKVPGVPDLDDLIDVDTLLLESGLIEEEEIRDDKAGGPYRPSGGALLRSTNAAKKAAKEEAMLETKEKGADVDTENERGGGDADADAGAGMTRQSISRSNNPAFSVSAITNRQKALHTPAGRLANMREKDLERDLLQMTERCIELQVSLNEEKANVDVLTNRSGSLSKKRLAQEATSLRQALDRKTHDLQAIIWKMNELHLINKTYNEKMANSEQHVTYLEESLLDLQNTNRRTILEREESEKKLRGEAEKLKVLVNEATIPLWQFGEISVAERTLPRRVILPIRGGSEERDASWADTNPRIVDDDNISEASIGLHEEEMLGSALTSRKGNEVGTRNAPVVHVNGESLAQTKVRTSDAFTQTSIVNIVEMGVMTEETTLVEVDIATNKAMSSDKVEPKGKVSDNQEPDDSYSVGEASTPPASIDKFDDDGVSLNMGEIFPGTKFDLLPQKKAPGKEKVNNPIVSTHTHRDVPLPVASQQTKLLPEPSGAEATKPPVQGKEVAKPSPDMFSGGKPSSFRARRFGRKLGPMIKPGVLKEAKKRSVQSSSRRSNDAQNRRSTSAPASRAVP
eukprot:CAMPEP_0198290056 /NCGR_PEP_ID=MMETSP1449-20131203/8041_1 /TAXON_ID=420275 /ORGANISM="Attheya septentrionalis, Strain CCMP2084" /LENGTH=1226 /DNA_ID=CAMNT_0043988485 /DNA_START=89 /DNA_END=3769 /DNA_ORIENTATION=-